MLDRTVGLLGPNGAGKSTLFNIATMSSRRSEGDIAFYGQSIYSGAGAQVEVGLCPQGNPLWEFLTVTEHLELLAQLKGLGPRTASEESQKLIRLLGMEKEAQKFPYMLSGGNLRKLSTAQAIIGAPRVAFFDEPSVGLDPENRRRLWSVLRLMLNQRENGIVMSTHRMDEAESVCTCLGIIVCGQLFAYGSPTLLKRIYGKGYRVYLKLQRGLLQDNRCMSKLILNHGSGKIPGDKVPGEPFRTEANICRIRRD